MKTHALALSALAAVLATPALAQGTPLSTEGFRETALMADSFEMRTSQLALQRSRNPAVRRYAGEMLRDHRATTAALSGGGSTYAGPAGPGGLIGAPLAAAGTVVGAATGAATGVVGGTLSGGPVGGLQGAGSGATAGAAAGARAFGGDVATTSSLDIVPLDARHQAILADLAAQPAGPGFDRMYGQVQVESHREAIGAYQAYLQGGYDPAMMNFVSAVLPSLEHHLAMAQRLPGARAAR